MVYQKTPNHECATFLDFFCVSKSNIFASTSGFRKTLYLGKGRNVKIKKDVRPCKRDTREKGRSPSGAVMSRWDGKTEWNFKVYLIINRKVVYSKLPLPTLPKAPCCFWIVSNGKLKSRTRHWAIGSHSSDAATKARSIDYNLNKHNTVTVIAFLSWVPCTRVQGRTQAIDIWSFNSVGHKPQSPFASQRLLDNIGSFSPFYGYYA